MSTNLQDVQNATQVAKAAEIKAVRAAGKTAEARALWVMAASVDVAKEEKQWRAKSVDNAADYEAQCWSEWRKAIDAVRIAKAKAKDKDGDARVRE